MSYIGNQVTSVPHTVDAFAGDGSTTSFGPLTRAPAGTAAIAVFIEGVYKTPGTDYTLNGNYIVFTVAPSNALNIIIHHLGNGTTTQVPSDGSVTGTKLAINSIRSNNIVAGQITGNLIGTGAVSGNQIALYSVSGNQIGVGAVSGNNIGIGAVSGNQIGTAAISGNLIGIKAVSGNQIGLGSISSNHFAGGGVTSDVLSANLSISTVRVAETINVVTTSVGGNYNVHVGNSTVYHFLANSAGNTTFNFVANDATLTGTTGRANDLIRIGQSVSVSMLWKQGSTRYRANVYVDGVLQTAYWAGNAQPQYTTSGGAQSMTYDAYNFSIIKIGNDQYTVFASNTPYGQANGQGMSSINTGFGPIQ